MSRLLTLLRAAGVAAEPPPELTEPMLLLSDTFTDTNGTHIASHAPEVGGPWVTPSGWFPQWATIQSNRANATNEPGMKMYADVGEANVRATMVMTTTAGGNFMNVRGGFSATDMTGGWRCRLNRFENKYDIIAPDNSIIATLTPGVAVGTGDYNVTITHYEGHVIFKVGSDILHGWFDDLIRGWTNAFTGTKLGPDWTSTNGGQIDTLEVYDIPRDNAKHISVIGDSISVFNRENHLWPQRVAESFNDGITRLVSRSVGGEGLTKNGSSANALIQAQSIVSDDDPDYVLIHIGTNDDSTAQAVIQTKMEEVLDELLAAYDADQIYVLQILPNTTETYHPANRLGIAAACTSRGVTLWDTSDWIDPTSGVDTSDGLHPNASGNAKIATEVLALLEA